MAPPEAALEEKSVSFNGLSQTCADGNSNGDELLPKVRKPYTITKQREKWTEEEHQKFLEALQLYGRAWRRIEEHIGTKTTVQIRSHAQKFFSKVTKESPNNGTIIEIPPPRPKRKPMHPYPRKLGNQKSEYSPSLRQLEKPIVQASPVSEEATGSPTSVLSGIGSENSDQIVCKSSPQSSGSGSESLDCRSQSPTTTSGGENLCADSDAVVKESGRDTQVPAIKLFGKMVVLSELKDSASPIGSTKNPKESVESDMQRHEQCTTATNPVVYYVPYTVEGVNVPAMMAPLPWWSVYGTWPFPIVNPVNGNFGQQENEKESSSTGSVTNDSEVVDETGDAGDRQENGSISSNKRKQEKHVRGFVPYKRHKIEATAGDAFVGL